MSLLQDLLDPQKKLLQYVIAQPYSRDVICTMLGLNKQVPLLWNSHSMLIIITIIIIGYLSTESEVLTGKSQTETFSY